MHSYHHNIKTFNSDTRNLTRVERSLYRDLIELYYDTEKPIPADNFDRLARKVMANTQEEREALQYVLDEYFIKTGNVYTHNYCDNQIEKYYANTTAKALAGKASAEARRLKNEQRKREREQQNLTGVEHTLNSVEQNSTNKKPETSKHEPLDITPTAKPSAKSKLDYSCWPSMPSEQVLADYLALRKSKRAAMSQTVINRLAKEFNLAAQYGVTVDQCLEMAVARGWQGFQWDWYQNSTRQQSGGKSQINLNETGWLHGTTDQQSVFGIGGNISGVEKCLPEPARGFGGEASVVGGTCGEQDHDLGAIEPWDYEG